MNTYDYRISAIRFLALLIVVVLHILQSNGVRTDVFPFFCGVPLFLIISGYLFGQERIVNTMQWYKKRLVRVWVPYVVLFVLNWIWVNLTKGGYLSPIEVVQGVLALPYFPLGKLGLAHCWYITYIMFCYLITPLLHNAKNILGGVFILFAIQVFAIISGYIPLMGKYSAIQPSLFAIAFFISKFGVNKPVYKYYILAGLILCLPLIIMSRFIGGSVSLLTIYWHAFISLSLFGVFLYSLSYVNWGMIMRESQICVVKWFDRNSYYIYLTHYWFTPMGLVNVFNTGFNIQNTLLFIACVMISTMLFSILIDKIIIKQFIVKR